MSTAAELIRSVTAAGGHLSLNGGHLRVQAPAPLPDSMMADLRLHKAGIHARLSKRRIVEYRLSNTKYPEQWMILLSRPGESFESAAASLKRIHGDALLDVRPYHRGVAS